MNALDRKLFRDLSRMKGQALAIALVMGSGIAIYVMSAAAVESLESARSAYYDKCRFAQAFTHLKRAPNALVARIAEIPGVSQVDARIVVDVVLDAPGTPEPVTGRLISLPKGLHEGLNTLHLRKGRFIEPGRRGEAVVSEPFAEANGIGPGDRVRAVINGRLDYLHIVGVGISPEYIYQIRPGELLPDDKRFGVFWMDYEELAPAYDLDGAFNDVALTLAPDANEAEVLQHLDNLTERYGGLGAYGRDEQLSHRLISDEIQQLRATAVITPSIFLAVAAFIINVAMSRLVNTQREQIAALKAFGYTRREVGLHYLKLVLMIAVIGACIGSAAGIWLGNSLTDIYAQYFRFPSFEYHISSKAIFLAFFFAAAMSVLGTIGTVLRAMMLPPAEAMHPEAPGIYHQTFIERIGRRGMFSPPTIMILRQLQRRPVRAVLSCLGMAFSVALLVIGNFTVDIVNYTIDFQFFRTQRQDMTLTLVESRSLRGFHEIARLPGVTRAEPFRSAAVRLRLGHRSRRTAIMGLPQERTLYRLLDVDEREVAIPPSGIMMSEKLAEILGARIGDTVTVEVMEGERPVREVRITGLIRDFSGTSAYMDIHALNAMLSEGDVVSGAFLTTDATKLPALYKEIKETPLIAGASLKKAALVSFRETLAKNLLITTLFYVIFSCIVTFGVAYNSIEVTLSERSRELATLRVIGFTHAETSYILLGEITILTLAAIPLGLALGWALAALTVKALATETQRFPLVIESSTYAFAAVTVLLATAASALGARRKLKRLSLVAVLKARD